MISLKELISFPSGHEIIWQFPLLMRIDGLLSKNWYNSRLVVEYSANFLCWWELMIPFKEFVSFSSGHGIICPFALLMGIYDTLPRIWFIPVRSWNNLPIPFVDGNWWLPSKMQFSSHPVMEYSTTLRVPLTRSCVPSTGPHLESL